MTQVAELHQLTDDFEVQRLARFVVQEDGRLSVIELGADGAAMARVLLAEPLADPFGRRVTAADGAEFLKTLRWARSSDFLWVTPLADLPPESVRDPATALPPFPEWAAAATVPYPDPPLELEQVRVAEVRWPAPEDYRRSEVVARLVSGQDGPVEIEGLIGSAAERALLERAVTGRDLDRLEGEVVAPGMVISSASFDRPGDKGWRDGLVRARGEAVASADQDAVERLDLELVTRLPRIWLSRCPFTGEVLRWAIDPYGVDGPYWDAAAPVRPLADELPPTFVGLAGAAAGPGGPPVFPSLLEQDGVRGVLSTTLVDRTRCDVVAYYAEPGRGAGLRVREWGTQFARTRSGSGWTWAPLPAPDPAVATDLAAWIERGRLSWIAPDDPGVELRTDVRPRH